MPAFSVNLIVRDASATLTSTLTGLRDLSDDIVVVVDSRSSDASEAIAKKFTSRVFTHPFSDYSAQRTFALTHARHDWVLSLDADEDVSPDLHRFLREFSASPSSGFSAYLLPRHNLIFGRVIRHTNWDPHGLIRLFEKTRGQWRGRIHEQWFTTGPVSRVTAPLIHHNYSTVAGFLSRLDTYTTAEAREHPRFSWPALICSPVWEFIRRFVIHAGFLDGFHGLFLSFLMGFYKLSVWVKVWQNQYVAI